MALMAELEKRCGDFQLQVSLRAEAGEPLALLGASGSGKSMALKCIAGIMRPDRGHVELDGKVLYDSASGVDLPPQIRRVGYLFQQYALFPNMTVAQNIEAGARDLGKEARKEQTRELIERFHLTGLERHRPDQLSGGQQQRTALARILASRPGAILLDEPFSALDSYLKWQMELELHDILSTFPGPVLWVSHDRGEVYRGCPKVCVMERGISSPVTDMKELMTDPGTVSAARLSGCTNFADMRPGNAPEEVEVPQWGLTLTAARSVSREKNVLGVRADMVCLARTEARNTFLCRVEQVTEDVSAMLVFLRPINAVEGAPLLRMELPKQQWAGQNAGDLLSVTVPPEALLPLQTSL